MTDPGLQNALNLVKTRLSVMTSQIALMTLMSNIFDTAFFFVKISLFQHARKYYFQFLICKFNTVRVY